MSTIHSGRRAAPDTGALVPTRVDRLVRADDQLRLTVEFLNLDVDPETQTLVAADRQEPFTGVRLVFGPQHTVEDPIATGDPVRADGADHRTARDSRLVYRLPPGTPYALTTILDLGARALELDDRALGDAVDTGEPGPDVTALEVVDSLVFSPAPDDRFVTDLEPTTHGDVTQLWRARMAPTPDVPAQLRAIWSRPGDPPFDRPLPAADRQRIVAATTVDPLRVDQLWLTTQGAFLDLDGVSDQLAYLHRVIAGRDVHVEVVERGFLAPFGVRATITTVTERQLRTDEHGDLTAILVQDDHLAVSRLPVTYPAPHMPHDGRAVPFPLLSAVDPGSGPVGRSTIVLADGTAIDPENVWGVARDGAAVLVTYFATDRTGRPGITFRLPATFVVDDHAFTVQDEVNGVPTPLGNLARFFADAPAEADLDGQPVGWADPDPRGGAGSTRPTTRIRLTLDRPALDEITPADLRDELEAASRPAFYPRVTSAVVVDDAVAALVGGGAGVEVTYAAAWLDDRNGAGNPGLAYLTLASSTTVDRAGTGRGLVRPALRVDTFSQTLGSGIDLPLVADPSGGDEPTVRWSPAAALGDAATLFGAIPLAQIVDLVPVAVDALGDDPRLPTFEVLLEEEGIFYALRWRPGLRSFGVAGELVFVVAEDLEDAGLPAFFGPGVSSSGSVELSQLVPVDDPETAVGTDFALRLDNVALRLPPGLPAIAIGFRSIGYHDPPDGTATLDTDVADWLFVNVLAFLEPVRRLVVTLLDLGDIDIGPDGVTAAAEIPAPRLSFGVVGVAGLDVGLGLDLPNAGSSTIGFHLSRRDDPFRVTVMGFGGTGSLELQLVADDIDFLIASIAVTYELAASLVVVSASLSAALGVELAYEDGDVTLTAYVELAGNVSVLGLVDITGKVLLALRYDLGTQVLSGTAAMSAEVDSLFGHAETRWQQTVSVALGSGDSGGSALLRTSEPVAGSSFEDRFSEAQWADYCAAFS